MTISDLAARVQASHRLYVREEVDRADVVRLAAGLLWFWNCSAPHAARILAALRGAAQIVVEDTAAGQAWSADGVRVE